MSIIKYRYMDVKTGAGKLYSLNSPNFKYAFHVNLNKGINTDYAKLQFIIDFISGMSDTYALNLHRHLTGISLPK